MRKASDKKIGWAAIELYDILWSNGTSESYEEMIGVARPLAESGNSEMQARLGRAYREGKGVEINVTKAEEWADRAANNSGVA